MKILLVHNAYQQPGGEDVVFNQERELLERAGHQVLTYCRSNWEISAYSGLKQVALLGRMVWARDTRQEIADVLASAKPDVVHVHNTFLMISPSIYSACYEANIPVVQTLHNYRLFCPAANFSRDGHACVECLEHNLWRGIYYGCYRESRVQTAGVALMLKVHRLLRTVGKMINIYVALSEFSRQKFVACGLPAERTTTKPNFVYPDPEARTRPGEYALFVGRLSPEKGLLTLLTSWTRMGARVPLAIVGDGPLASRLLSEVQARSLNHVSLRGRLARADTYQAIKSAGFLILPSECYENFPMSVVEAFACGVPVICSRAGAMQEIVADGRTGLHFTPGDADDLAKKVEWAWTHRAEMAAMGRAARAEYEAKYTAERNYAMLMDIYQRAANSKALSPC